MTPNSGNLRFFRDREHDFSLSLLLSTFVRLNIYLLINVYLKISLMEDLTFLEFIIDCPFRAFFHIISKMNINQTSNLVLFPEN